MRAQSVAIIGAGISGLTLALSLSRHGIRSVLHEQAEELKEVGAGLQISPNASRILDRIGILDGLRRLWTEPSSIDLRSGITLRTQASIPAGPAAEERWKAPYGVVHRATLQKCLLDAVLADPNCSLRVNSRVAPEGLRDLRLDDGSQPDVIVGADGVWSRSRGLIDRAPRVRFTGNIAWRFVLPFSEAPAVLPRDRVTAYMGPGAHLICYPLKDGGGFNLVAITGGTDPGESWGMPGEPKRVAALRANFSGWNPALRILIDRHADLLYWPLCEAGDGAWQNGRDLVLIGDAAHAMMPFMAQGAAMAIEDAFVLARHLATADVPAAIAAYEAERKPRIRRLRKRADFNRMVYHARGPLRLGRDIVMAMKSRESYMADLDWIYGFEA
jgi:salicylate hydroxylase